MQRISIVAVTAIAAIAVGGTAADAAVKKGKFAGTTAENDPIGFKVTKTHKVTRLYFEGVTLHCSNGDTTDTPSGDDRIELPSRLKFKIKKSRRFTVAVHSDLGLRINARGRFNKKGRKA